MKISNKNKWSFSYNIYDVFILYFIFIFFLIFSNAFRIDFLFNSVSHNLNILSLIISIWAIFSLGILFFYGERKPFVIFLIILPFLWITFVFSILGSIYIINHASLFNFYQIIFSLYMLIKSTLLIPFLFLTFLYFISSRNVELKEGFVKFDLSEINIREIGLIFLITLIFAGISYFLNYQYWALQFSFIFVMSSEISKLIIKFLIKK